MQHNKGFTIKNFKDSITDTQTQNTPPVAEAKKHTIVCYEYQTAYIRWDLDIKVNEEEYENYKGLNTEEKEEFLKNFIQNDMEDNCKYSEHCKFIYAYDNEYEAL